MARATRAIKWTVDVTISILRSKFEVRARQFWKATCEIVVTSHRSSRALGLHNIITVSIISALEFWSVFVSSAKVSSVTIPTRRKVQKAICDNINLKSIKLSRMYNESVIPVKTETFSGMAAKSPISLNIKSVLRRACVEKRLTVGLLPAIQYLSSNCNGALFCLTAEAPPGDSATHMQEVLLQAFCVENGIHVIKVDSENKMRQLLGCRTSSIDFSCVLVHYPYTDPFSDYQKVDLSILSDAEKDLIDYCENNWDYAQMPVIKLPEK